MYVIQYVRILTLIIVLIVYLTLWSLKHHSVNPGLQFPYFHKYSSFNLTSMLSSIKATLSSGLTSELLVTNYRNTQMCDHR